MKYLKLFLLFSLVLPATGFGIAEAKQITREYLTFDLPENWQSKTETGYDVYERFISPHETELALTNYGYDFYTFVDVEKESILKAFFLPQGTKDFNITIKKEKTEGMHKQLVYKYAGTAVVPDEGKIEWQYYITRNYRYRGTGNVPSDAIEGFIFTGKNLSKDQKAIDHIIESVYSSRKDRFSYKRYKHHQGFSFEVPEHWPRTQEFDYGEVRFTSRYSGYVRTEVFTEGDIIKFERMIEKGYFSSLFDQGRHKIKKKYSRKSDSGIPLRILEGYGYEPVVKIMSSSNSVYFILFKISNKKTGALMIFGSLETGKPVLHRIINSISVP